MFCGYFGNTILFLLTKVCSYCDVRITEVYCGISTGTLSERLHGWRSGKLSEESESQYVLAEACRGL